MNKIISHETKTPLLQSEIEVIQERIHQTGEFDGYTIEQQLKILNELAMSEFGKFLLLNKGLNGYWTHYALTYPFKKPNIHLTSEIDKFLLEAAPTVLATQERFRIFLRENQEAVKNEAILASIPCGLMGELLLLNYSGITDIQLIGIDFDTGSLRQAKLLSQENQLQDYVTLEQKDAWELNHFNQFDLISSNGLNIYEPDDNRVTELYRQFYLALKPNARLVTSFLTPPPMLSTDSPWNMKAIDMSALKLQKLIFSHILNVKWQCYRTEALTRAQLETAGFQDIQFIYDKARMFPTVTAIKNGN